MEEVIKKHYTGNAAELYVARRQNNPKWQMEQSVVEDFVSDTQDISTVIDAPLGTNRYGIFLEGQDHITKVSGYEFADDMIKEAEKIKSTKLHIHKHDLVNNPITEKADLSIIMRMLNLFPQNRSEQILNNVLCATEKYCILSLRHWPKKPALIDGKVWIQNLTEIFDIFLANNFYVIGKKDVKDKQRGQYSIFTLRKEE
jgi:hypothetical protein|tara:strand:+ start:598 stop:1197 length:600 start_codon:yes stop_codon:yes gene_type:complete